LTKLFVNRQNGEQQNLRGREMFELTQKLADNVADEIKELLDSLNARTTWTQRCKLELEQLKKALEAKKYIYLEGHPKRYHLYSIGESCLYDVPVDRRGALTPFRGKRIRLVCVSSGRYSRLLMAGVVGETPKKLLTKKPARQYKFPDIKQHDIVYRSPRYLAAKVTANPIAIFTKDGSPLSVVDVDFVLFDGALQLPIGVLRQDKKGNLYGKLVGRFTKELPYSSMHDAIRALVKGGKDSPWLFT
jgi:hypothetical protein